jgi:molybdate transport system substrate-binding protein
VTPGAREVALAAALGLAAGCTGSESPGPVRILAAASLGPALEEFAAVHTRETGDEVAIGTAASSVLAKQIDAGAPADLFLAADPRWMDWLAERGRLEPGTRRDLLRNDLVIAAPSGRGFPPPPAGGSLAKAFAGRLALGDPDHTPVGRYAKAALESAGWWEEVSSRLVPAADARAALALVERGECAAGVLYASDAAGSRRVEIVARIPASRHPPIVYPVAVISGRDRPAVRRALARLTSPEGLARFERFGFRRATDGAANASLPPEPAS